MLQSAKASRTLLTICPRRLASARSLRLRSLATASGTRTAKKRTARWCWTPTSTGSSRLRATRLQEGEQVKSLLLTIEDNRGSLQAREEISPLLSVRSQHVQPKVA